MSVDVTCERRVYRSTAFPFPATLRWCNKHEEAVWVHSDGSYHCPHDLIVESISYDHEIIDGPWEIDPWDVPWESE